MRTVRLHDPGRRPADWTEIIQPGQFAVFAKHEATGVPCSEAGTPFSDPATATCVLFDSFAEARAFCERASERNPAVRFDVFDADGRIHPPLLTIVHPSRAAALETSPRQMRTRQAIAWGLIAAGVPLMAFAFFQSRERDIILPAFLGINFVLIAGRLLWINLAMRETERARERRLESASAERRGDAR